MRAAAARQSLQEYLRGRLIEEASLPTIDEILERAGGEAVGPCRSPLRLRRLRRIVLVVDASVLAPVLAEVLITADAGLADVPGPCCAIELVGRGFDALR